MQATKNVVITTYEWVGDFEHKVMKIEEYYFEEYGYEW